MNRFLIQSWVQNQRLTGFLHHDFSTVLIASRVRLFGGSSTRSDIISWNKSKLHEMRDWAEIFIFSQDFEQEKIESQFFLVRKNPNFWLLHKNVELGRFFLFHDFFEKLQCSLRNCDRFGPTRLLSFKYSVDPIKWCFGYLLIPGFRDFHETSPIYSYSFVLLSTILYTAYLIILYVLISVDHRISRDCSTMFIFQLNHAQFTQKSLHKKQSLQFMNSWVKTYCSVRR
jgi:hypothetical protein